MHDFRRLDVWQRGMGFAERCYDLSRTMPDVERFGLASQLRRAAASVPSNIAEAAGSDSPRQFRRYLRIAYGSACEVETQIRLASSQGWFGREETDAALGEIDEIRAMLFSLMNNER